ncbi:hypothetical protein C7K38_07455 [Tetragenococcus osmophilus]|uniref:Uncharacterized protein n=1 Tax=Tetragenococcus osmophilus TaxID=526944 RepID=A0AA37XK31_9ENTE|nr:hypothetical protein [Tetragenococcus osmophilus]AYW48225.1 hypothetical protein C7K38_07455 [Tetragenococcus osmophilus]GMA54006.1 hypothetical protein GCM10025857_53630 [Alicyclobacillus contaminans]GMA72097.1 hypothetical protein GCM10025885_11460 [Tetragenococcus osmophilus]
METFIAIAIGIFLFIWAFRTRSCLLRLIALVLFLFLLWIYRIEVANVVDQIGQYFNIEDMSGRLYDTFINMWQRLTQWFGQLLQ